HTDSGLVTKKEKFENGERVAFYKPNADRPEFFQRTDFPDQVYGDEDVKDEAIVREVKRVSETGRPILLGTTSVEHSEKIHRMLKRENIAHNVLNAKMHQSEALVVAQAGRPGAVTISTNMAGRGTDILLGGNPEGLAAAMVEDSLFDRNLLNQLAIKLISDGEEKARQQAENHSKLSPDLVGKMLEVKAEFDAAAAEIEEVQVVGYIARKLKDEHEIDYTQALHVLQLVQVRRLNAAREYLKELEIDTIVVDEAVRLLNLHTNYQVALQDERKMAQFLAEQVFDLHYTARAALIRAVLGDRLAEAQRITETIPAMPATLITQIQALVKDSEQERRRVWELGGLHVIGSERHESRRIDNQLRGRAARQGDPGSSRFFLSLEDDLMRRFGGERLRSFMTRNVPDDLPIESSVLDRIIASSQERIEGYNFDIRKNVLEYDDVMARQREATYDERRRILTGELDLDEKVQTAFNLVIDELVDNFLDNYIGYVQGEIERAIADFSAEATGDVNLRGVLTRLRSLLPIRKLEMDVVADMDPDQLSRELMKLARENERDGRNLYQLLQAMSRFIPLLPAVPNLAAILSSRRSGHLQALNNVQQSFTTQIRQTFDDFLAKYIDPTEREEIWQKALQQVEDAFEQFSVTRPSAEVFQAQQIRFRQQVNGALQALLIDSLSALDSEQLVVALNEYVDLWQNKWRERIGDEEYRRFQRSLLLSAIDREWRDYLTAADDLRREIGLESAGRQRDPKVEYKKRSYEMFADMRNNIQRDIADRFFRQIQSHEDFMRQQAEKAAAEARLSNAGYQVVQRQQGKGVELRREMPKVGRNDPCPCGSGKKYKQCHGRKGGPRNETATTTNGSPARKKKRSRR
ncbi:MAG: SEC-C domain-containing protein, partial [Anaerolineales bacterium]|nr:SEC-C domain-containing protein [Anaerolineales bacterium]